MKKTDPAATKTRVARAGAGGRHRFFGHDLFDDLLPDTTMAGLLFLSVTGRIPTAPQLRLLDRLAVVTSVADGRIWPLKLTRLGAAYGSVLPGFAAGQLAIEGETIGMWPVTTAARQLFEFSASKAGTTERVDAVRRWIGFGVPFRREDERVLALTAYLAREGWTRRRFFRAHARLAGEIRARRNLEPNIVSVVAALMLDMGCSPEQSGALAFFLNVNVFVAHAFESASAPSASLQDLGRATEFRGRAPRDTPRKRALR
jgi:hypothetical protein